MVKLIAKINAQPCQADAVAAALAELAVPSRAEAGCILYDTCRVKDNPATLVVLEEWESQEALDAHMATPHFQAFIAAIGSALAGEPELTVLERL